MDDSSKEHFGRRDLFKRTIGINSKPDGSYSLTSTARLGLIFVAAEMVSVPLVVGSGLNVGNAGYDEEAVANSRKNPVTTFVLEDVMAPILEEALFRGIPDALAGQEGIQWKWGLPATLLFGFLHNYVPDKEKNYYFNTSIFPLYQLMSGAFNWVLTRKRGLPHAMLAHSVNNSAAHLYDLIIQ